MHAMQLDRAHAAAGAFEVQWCMQHMDVWVAKHRCLPSTARGTGQAPTHLSIITLYDIRCGAWAGTQSWLGSGLRACSRLSLLWPRAAWRRWLQTPCVRRLSLMCLPLRWRTLRHRSSATGKSHLPLTFFPSPQLLPSFAQEWLCCDGAAIGTCGGCARATNLLLVTHDLWNFGRCEAVHVPVRVAMRAMSSLQEAHEAILQFLEAAGQGDVDARDPIILAAIISLGRCTCFQQLQSVDTQ